MAVLVGAVHWGRNGGFFAAVAATLLYILIRIPTFLADGLTSPVLELIVIHTLAYGLVGILGGELCIRMKYIFASMEDANSLDHVTHVFNERYLSCRLEKTIGEHERYGSHVSLVLLMLDPALYLPLRKLKQRELLLSVAFHIRNTIRLVDDLGRLNDGRFLLILPNTPREGGEITADRMRASVRELLGARDESITVEVLGTPDDLCEMKGFLGTLDDRNLGIERQEASVS